MPDVNYEPDEESPVKGILVGMLASLAFVAAWLIVATQTGCTTEGELDRAVVTNAIHIVKDIVVTVREESRKETVSDPVVEDGTGEGETPAVHGSSSTGSGSSSGSTPTLVWKYGGFNGSKAVEDPNTQISDLHMTRSGMRYKWAKGSLRNWGVTPDTNAGALACAFFWDGKQWIGGKFDHISTSRTTRDFKNLEDYKGWRSGPFFAAQKRAFCIVSADGKKRTNLLETKEP